MDRIGADYFEVIREIREKLKANPVPVQIPVGSESSYEGNIDLIRMQEVSWSSDDQGTTFEYKEIRDSLKDLAEEWRENLIDSLSAFSDEMTELFLDGSDIPSDLIHKVMRQETIRRSVIPCFTGSSLKNKGVQPVLDAVVNYLPAPEDLPPVKCFHTKKEEYIELQRDVHEKPAGLIFKIQQDKEAGPLCFIRMYSGRTQIRNRCHEYQ